MSIVRCPECGRQVSDKAPSCPSCGVQIAGKITQCSNCGEVFFTADNICPACHHAIGHGVAPAESPRVRPADEPNSQGGGAGVKETPAPSKPAQEPKPGKPRKSNAAAIIASVVFAAIICGALFYFYQQSNAQDEQEEYEIALRSEDPLVLQSYLDRFADAPKAHIDSINALLIRIQKSDEDWRNAVLSNSRTALQQYLESNPSSPHRQEALNKIDSLDWLTAKKNNTMESVTEYTTQHPDGRYIDDANEVLTELRNVTVQPEEREMIQSLFRKFFQSINSRSENELIACTSMILDSFLGRTSATHQDVITFMNKLYKDDITNLNWHIDNTSYKFTKKQVDNEEFEYAVTFNANEVIDRTDPNKEKNVMYRISAIANSQGVITSFNMTKLN